MTPKAAPLPPFVRLCLAALPCLLAAGPGLATDSGAVLAWRLADGASPPAACGPTEGATLPCGAWGDYVLAEGPLPVSGCGTTAAGNESPPAFVPSGWPAPAPGEWFPCLGGECFAEQPGAEPWAAAIDWDDPHGWSVGATLLEAADGRVEARLFPLDAPPQDIRPLLAEFPVGDAHLLAQLCTIAEELETGAAEPPLVVNISAGRLATGGGANSHEAPTLAGQILGLIDHLSGTHGIAFVAAAGHHRTVLFPAHLPPVLAAGPVDLQKQRHTGQSRPSWLADGELRALFPASGLELEWGGGCWPVPAGTSFASATAAGWIAAYLEGGGDWLPGDAAAVWTTMEIAGRYHLARNRNPLPGTDLDGPSDLVAGAVEGNPCGAAPNSATAVLDVGEPIPNPIHGLPSLVELVDAIGPSPENEPCVPCDIRYQLGGGEVVLLEASRPLVPEYEIVDLYLLTGGIFHPLEGEEKPSILEALATAGVTALELRGFSDVHVEPWLETLLVFHLDDGEHGLWTAVPIDLLP